VLEDNTGEELNSIKVPEIGAVTLRGGPLDGQVFMVVGGVDVLDIPDSAVNREGPSSLYVNPSDIHSEMVRWQYRRDRVRKATFKFEGRIPPA
jgi:hypothetical protein